MTKTATITRTRDTKRTTPSRFAKRPGAGLNKRQPAAMELNGTIYLSDADAKRPPIADKAEFQEFRPQYYTVYLMRDGRFVGRVTMNWGDAMRIAVETLFHGAPEEILPDREMALLERALAFQVTQKRNKEIEKLCDDGKITNDDGWKLIWKAARDPMAIEMPWERERHERDADRILKESADRREAERINAELAERIATAG